MAGLGGAPLPPAGTVLGKETTVCDECLATAAAANRVPARNVGRVEWMHVHGTGVVPRKPALESYDWTFPVERRD